MYMPKIKDKSALIISILIPIAIGDLSAPFSNNMSSYATLVKPPLSPPSFIFPIVCKRRKIKFVRILRFW